MPNQALATSNEQQLTDFPPDVIERHVGRLIREYVRSQSPDIAHSVLRHIEALCLHPGFEGGSRERCAYLRLRAHWRWIADDAGSRQIAA